MKATKSPIRAVATWLRRQPPKMKAFLAVLSGMATLLFLKMVVEDNDNLFVAAQAVHALGTCVLIYKLSKEKTCAGNWGHWRLLRILVGIRIVGVLYSLLQPLSIRVDAKDAHRIIVPLRGALKELGALRS